MARIVVHALLLILVSGIAVNGAQGQEKKPLQHLKKDDPNTIYVNYSQDPACKSMYEKVVDNELARSRIKRKTLWDFNEVSLFVTVHCSEKDSGQGFIFTLSVNFGKLVPAEIESDRSFIIVYWEPGQFGSYGVSTYDSEGTQMVRNYLRNAMEDALTDYLKANFDL